MTRHKWADVIVAWAEGVPIQSQYIPRGPIWRDCEEGTPDFNNVDCLFRLKPEPRYQWVIQNEDGSYSVTREHYACADEIRNTYPSMGWRIVQPIEETRREE